MFRNLKKKTIENFNWKKDSKFYFSSCVSFVFVLYTLIFPYLLIFAEKNYLPE